LRLVDLRWATSYRIIATRIPRVRIFEDVAAPEDLDNVLAIEAITNDRLREVAETIRLVPIADRVVGPGSSFIMAPFAYKSLGRFSPNGALGAYYAAESLSTAIAETSYRRRTFYAATNELPLVAEERVIEAAIAAKMAIASDESDAPALLDPDAYAASHRFGARVYDAGADGVVYPSVRRASGECVAVFRPRCISNARTTKYLGFRWDGAEIVDVFELRSLTQTYPEEPGAR
jgi:RES domain-containing protein